MKIVEILFYLAYGGAERFVVDLSNELARKGHDVTILTLKDDSIDPETRKFYYGDVADDVKYINLGLSDSKSPAVLLKVYEAIKKLNPDVVHLHLSNTPLWCLYALMRLHKKVKFVETIHNSIKNSYDGFIRRVLFSTIGRWKWMQFACLSQTNFDELQAMHPDCKAVKIVNGRAPQKTTSKLAEVHEEMNKLRSAADSLLLLNIARCNKQKNHKRLVQAVNELNDEGVHVDVAIIGGGYDDTELGHELKAMASEHIHFWGTRNNIADYLVSVDAFCLSSDHEGMPITLIEAFLCGTPTVSTPVCGCIDAIKDGFNGILAKDFSVEEYKAAIRRFIESKDVIKQNLDKGKGESEFSISVCAEKYIELFKR